MVTSTTDTDASSRPSVVRSIVLGARRLDVSLATHLRPLGVPVSDAWVLLFLLEGRETRMTALARALGITFSTMTEVADRLERKGWLERQRDPLDRRAVALRLTTEGNGLALEVARKLLTVEREVARAVSRSDRDACRRVIESALRVLGA